MLDPNSKDACKIAELVEQVKCPGCSTLTAEVATRDAKILRLSDTITGLRETCDDLRRQLSEAWESIGLIAALNAPCTHTHLHRGHCPECAKNELSPTGPDENGECLNCVNPPHYGECRRQPNLQPPTILRVMEQ